jgi:hypothetical protein
MMLFPSPADDGLAARPRRDQEAHGRLEERGHDAHEERHEAATEHHVHPALGMWDGTVERRKYDDELDAAEVVDSGPDRLIDRSIDAERPRHGPAGARINISVFHGRIGCGVG